jgi:hypothetical protein
MVDLDLFIYKLLNYGFDNLAIEIKRRFFLKIRWPNFDFIKKTIFSQILFFFRNLHIKISLENNFLYDQEIFW